MKLECLEIRDVRAPPPQEALGLVITIAREQPERELLTRQSIALAALGAAPQKLDEAATIVALVPEHVPTSLPIGIGW